MSESRLYADQASSEDRPLRSETVSCAPHGGAQRLCGRRTDVEAIVVSDRWRILRVRAHGGGC